MTKEELTKEILQMGFELIESTERCDTFKKEEMEVSVYDYEMKTKWYIGTKIQERVSVHQAMTWKNRRYNSRAFQWHEIKEFKKQIKNGKLVHKPVNDKSIRQGGLLPDEA